MSRLQIIAFIFILSVATAAGFIRKSSVSFSRPQKETAVVQGSSRKKVDAGSREALLIEALSKGELTTVEKLLDEGADPNAESDNGDKAIMMAAGRGYTSIVKSLLAKGADVNARDEYGNTALITAASDRYTAIVDTLLANGAEVDAENNYGDTALI